MTVGTLEAFTLVVRRELCLTGGPLTVRLAADQRLIERYQARDADHDLERSGVGSLAPYPKKRPLPDESPRDGSREGFRRKYGGDSSQGNRSHLEIEARHPCCTL